MLRFRAICGLIAMALVTLAVAACGSSGGSSGPAASLLRQTFGGKHPVNSGNLAVTLTLTPSGSSTLKSPITVNFGGPFASLGGGKLPQSSFTATFSALGQSGSLGIVSTGSAGYITLSGVSYKLPPSTFGQLDSSFSSIASTSSGASGAGALGKLGIDPLHWVVNPSIVGNESVSGASTTHIRAGVNVLALLGDINTLLGKAPAIGISGVGKVPSSISPASRQRIAADIRHPRVDVWTGTADKTLRKLQVNLGLSVHGQLSALLGSATQISVTMSYADLNQPQTITAPSNVRPYSQFQKKLSNLLAEIVGLGGAGGALGSSPSGSSSSSSAADNSYAQCLTKAGSDVRKIQKCAPLLNGK